MHLEIKQRLLTLFLKYSALDQVFNAIVDQLIAEKAISSSCVVGSEHDMYIVSFKTLAKCHGNHISCRNVVHLIRNSQSRTTILSDL